MSGLMGRNSLYMEQSNGPRQAVVPQEVAQAAPPQEGGVDDQRMRTRQRVMTMIQQFAEQDPEGMAQIVQMLQPQQQRPQAPRRGYNPTY